jgi:two-component system LytT family sensor kinase
LIYKEQKRFFGKYDKQPVRQTTMTRHEILGFNDLKIAPLIILLYGLMTPIIFFGAKPLELTSYYLVNCVISGIMSTIYYFSIVEIIVRMRRRYPSAKDTDKRLIRQVTWAVFVIIAVQTLIYTISSSIAFDSRPLVEPTGLQVLLASIFLSGMTMSFYELFYMFKKYKEAEVAREKLQRINLQSQLNTLKNQVNPHFLFNSLNTLTSLIPEDPNLAVEFVQKLSSSYRNILTFRDEKLISLEKELHALDSYIYLLKIRFQDKIILENNIPASLYEHLIIPLSLQMLIENAVKHNIVSVKRPLTINLNVADNYLIISNNKQIKLQDHNSTKVGLENIKARYRLVNDTEVKVIETEDTFKVELPLIKIVL